MRSTTASPFSGPAGRRLLLFGLPLLAAAGAFVGVFFQPHKLFLDERVDEAAPAGLGAGREPGSGATALEPRVAPPSVVPNRASGGATAAGASGVRQQPEVAAPAPTAPVIVASGRFRSLEHSTTGQSVVTELPDGSRVLRIENLETSNGPDLRVYLSSGSNDANFGAEYGRDFVELGRLKGNLGNQNYVIPPGVDLAHYRNAVIWCARFSVGFGVATLG